MTAVVVEIKGGLGNQMFQFATGFNLAKKSGLPLYLDIAGLRRDRLRGFELDAFRLDAPILSPARSWLARRNAMTVSGLARNWLRPGNTTGQIRRINEPHFHVSEDLIRYSGPAYLKGYWQSEKYFADSRTELRNVFQVSEPFTDRNRELLRDTQNSQSISLHVRRGDYVDNPKTRQFHGMMGMDYYDEAVELMKRQIPAPRFFVFSDDPDWVRSKFGGSDHVTVVDWNKGSSPAVDMQLMASCAHHIIANSSFSWWGAWLGEKNTDKIVIAPKNWFANAPNSDTRDLIPVEWTRI